jgi:arylsulfatase
LPALTNHADTPHERLFFHLRDAVAVREGSLKLIRPKANAGWELYDLAADPSEKHNLATKRPQDVQRLADAITQWQLDMKNDASEPVPYRREKGQ